MGNQLMKLIRAALLASSFVAAANADVVLKYPGSTGIQWPCLLDG